MHHCLLWLVVKLLGETVPSESLASTSLRCGVCVDRSLAVVRSGSVGATFAPRALRIQSELSHGIKGRSPFSPNNLASGCKDGSHGNFFMGPLVVHETD